MGKRYANKFDEICNLRKFNDLKKILTREFGYNEPEQSSGSHAVFRGGFGLPTISVKNAHRNCKLSPLTSKNIAKDLRNAGLI